MKEVLAMGKLSPIKVGTGIEVPLALLNGGSDFLGRHLPIAHLAVPDAECRTWG